MKICFLADINSTHTQKWITYFSGKGHDIHVISLNDGSFKGAKVHSLYVDESVSKKNASLSKFEYLRKIKKIKEILKEIKPDILNAHYASSYGLLGVLTKFHPLVISVWGSDIFDFPNRSIIHKNIIKYNLKKSDYIFSTGNIMKEEILKYVNKDVEITPFGIDINIFDGTKSIHDGIVLGIAKSLEEIYGIDLLLKAFSKLNKKYSNLSLKIAGKGTLESDLKELCKELQIQDKVEFLGFLNIDGMREFYRQIDIAVFPSRQESFGVAALEAQASRIPVVTSDAPGFKETVIQRETGFICRKESVSDLVENIEKLINDEILRESMGNKGRNFIEENYILENNFKDIEKLFYNIINF